MFVSKVWNKRFYSTETTSRGVFHHNSNVSSRKHSSEKVYYRRISYLYLKGICEAI